MYILARYATRRPVAVTVMAAAIIMMGWIAWKDLPLDLLPDIQSPTILVSIKSGDRPPTEMERQYGKQVEWLLFAVNVGDDADFFSASRGQGWIRLRAYF